MLQLTKLLEEISKFGDENQGCLFKKVKLSNESNDFILTDYTIITRSKIAYQKVQHDLNHMTVSRYTCLNFSFSVALNDFSFRYADFHLGIVTKYHFKYKANLSELFNLYCPRNHQKTKGFLMISEGIEVT